MKIKDVLKMVRDHRGPVLAGVLTRDDVIYVQVVKSDLLDRIEGLGDDVVSAHVVGSALFIDN